MHKLLDDEVLQEKNYKISENMLCTVAGITADANILINKLRYVAADYHYQVGPEENSEECSNTAKILVQRTHSL